MSDYDRGKFHTKKKFYSSRDSMHSTGRSFFGSKYEGGSSSRSNREPKESSGESPSQRKPPTILIKAREPTEDIGASPKRGQKEEAPPAAAMPSVREMDVQLPPTTKTMTKSIKLIDEGILCSEALQDYLQDNNEFLVVGVIGTESVGKSTVMNLLAHSRLAADLKKALFPVYKENEGHEDHVKILTDHIEKVNLKSEETIEKEVFKIESMQDILNGCNCTQGIDIFVTENRLILLDCQPVGSAAILEDLIKSETKRTSLVSEFIPPENSGEIQSLQLTAFLMSVCHILLVVQDWFFDSYIIRFIQSAEMLKPTIPNPEDELSEHYPHLVLVHNKAQLEDFNPSTYYEMHYVYNRLLRDTKLNKSELCLGMNKVFKHFDEDKSLINLFLIPEVDLTSDEIYSGHPPIEEIVKRFRTEILRATRNPLTHVQLSEKTWLMCCSKVWETVKKSPFFVEYTKLMP
ncbi:unnamed protein product [Callosobruchus maculatus]|uniref:Protein SMG9 n=2 Tax=Callosobruchus maculatus TaxID=64391 RepID=A0A653DG69_CALMS|nr:unnamed protein product [Callosobruchus maculatus]